MNNNNSKKDIIKIISQYLASINPYEFTTIATILGYVFSIGLTTSEQNAVGNWFELIGQIMLTVSSQASATPTNEEYQRLLNDVETLKQEIERLKNQA